MYTAQPSHIDHIKQINAGKVYKLIDQFGPISRIDLSKLSALAPASITKISRELIDGHLIHETVVQEATSRGRPAVGLQTNNQGWQFLSLRLGRGYLTIALHELGGEVITEKYIDIEQREQDEMLARLLDEIYQFFEEKSAVLERMTSIAITLPGLVHSQSGLVLQMPHFNVKHLELGPAIYKATGLPVFIANDTRAWALAEKLFGNSQQNKNSVLISVHNGIGAGIILEDKVLQGRLGNVGELGHIQIDPNGDLCHCGNKGCLETVASSYSLLRQAKQAIADGEETCLKLESLSVINICMAANNGDPVALKIITKLGQHLGMAVSLVVNMFNPEKVLIGGDINVAKGIIIPEVIRCVKTQSLPIYNQDLEIMPSRFIKNATMPGAALIKQALYDGELLMKLVEG
ncbi:transcriptional regulator [Vibrio sp. UCD-FRSSP16_10]|uniref:sugar metabolism global transcriptional regulator Mlc n=1 Tax=unclassified Vibrio TaxID=2614977 RepID=UPI0007FD02C3|nr:MULTISPECIES: ROK family protein [unclassified Vibrio]OBT08505.1 transcriptional regulator [Vibrio sp. UCD-FRSSP16_30]OBT18035.1 transcriptional regulator [Vibrio sp. UCD-FRSSP16_10]